MQVTKNAPSFQLGVPPYQWRIEMFAWFNYLLAVTQSTITHLAAGPGIVQATFDQLIEPLESRDLCHDQLMGAPDGYANINVLGLLIVITLSAAVIITNLTLIQILRCLHRRNHHWFPSIELWREDGMLYIQQKAYEGIGQSNWSSTILDVPVISGNPLLPYLSGEINCINVADAATEVQDVIKLQSDNHQHSSSSVIPRSSTVP